MSLPISVCAFMKICGEKVLTLFYVARSLKLEKLLMRGSRTILFCFCHQIKVPKLGALTLFKVSWGMGQFIPPGIWFILWRWLWRELPCTMQRWEKPGCGAVYYFYASLESTRSSGVPGGIDLLCHRHSEEQSLEYHKTEVKVGFWNYTPSRRAAWAHLLTLTRRAQRWEEIFTLCFAGARNAMGTRLWMKIT